MWFQLVKFRLTGSQSSTLAQGNFARQYSGTNPLAKSYLSVGLVSDSRLLHVVVKLDNAVRELLRGQRAERHDLHDIVAPLAIVFLERRVGF